MLSFWKNIKELIIDYYGPIYKKKKWEALQEEKDLVQKWKLWSASDCESGDHHYHESSYHGHYTQHVPRA